jgi:hypothetical protein
MRVLLLLLPVLLSAQSALEAPVLAQVLDDEGFLTPVHGLAGNFVAGRRAPGPALLAYSNDGEIEWRLEPGRLIAIRDGAMATVPTTATRAIFRGDRAVLPESNETWRLAGDTFVYSSDEPLAQLAGRVITWRDGKLRIFQRDGAEEDVDCPQEPDRMTAAAANWAHVSIAGRAHLLRLTPGKVELFVLPRRGRP